MLQPFIFNERFFKKLSVEFVYCSTSLFLFPLFRLFFRFKVLKITTNSFVLSFSSFLYYFSLVVSIKNDYIRCSFFFPKFLTPSFLFLFLLFCAPFPFLSFAFQKEKKIFLEKFIVTRQTLLFSFQNTIFQVLFFIFINSTLSTKNNLKIKLLKKIQKHTVKIY